MVGSKIHLPFNSCRITTIQEYTSNQAWVPNEAKSKTIPYLRQSSSQKRVEQVKWLECKPSDMELLLQKQMNTWINNKSTYGVIMQHLLLWGLDERRWERTQILMRLYTKFETLKEYVPKWPQLCVHIDIFTEERVMGDDMQRAAGWNHAVTRIRFTDTISPTSTESSQV